MSWMKNLKNHSFWSVVISYSVQQQKPFLDQIVMKSGFYMTTGDDQLSGWTKKMLQSTSQSQTCTKKQVMVTGGLLPVWSTIVFWTPAKPLHLRSMLSKSMRCTQNCSACSQHWSTERAQFSPQQPPSMHPTTNVSKVEWIGLQSFASPALFTWPLNNWLPFLQESQPLFVGKMLPQSTGDRKCFPRVCRIPKHWFLHYRNIPTYSSGKNVLILMVPILINKDMFEPSYNDLKFMV